ncbi:TAXI family TRAP transporter solute-binding subunit [Thermodesulfobacteriota bacterium]
MKAGIQKIIVGICITALALAYAPRAYAKSKYIFGGGPAGGTFFVVANGIQSYRPVKSMADFSIKAVSTGGSIENLRKTDAGKYHFSTVYSSHVWLGRNGKMKNDPRRYKNVLAISWLYGAPAQLVVRKGSGIRSVTDLAGKRVGVGNAGSGAFANCEVFFSHLDVWNRIERNAMGYNDAAAAFGKGRLDAFWLFTAFPSGAAIMAAQINDIDLIDLDADARASGFYDKYPFYGRLTIPSGTYKGVDRDTPTFQDSALWVANADVPADDVYRLLSLIYSDEGLRHMSDQKRTFKQMSRKNGLQAIVTPIHPGALRFFKDAGVEPEKPFDPSSFAIAEQPVNPPKRPSTNDTIYARADTTPPRIIITSHSRDQNRGIEIAKKTRIRGRVEDASGVVEVLVDGREAYMDASGAFYADVFLSVGTNRIRVNAMDRFENRAEEIVVISRQPPDLNDQPKAQLAERFTSEPLHGWYAKQYALVAGIDSYQNNRIPRLGNAVNDARAISDMLRKMGYELTELYNEQATRSNIIHGFSKIKKKSRHNDGFIFYFAGHGQGLTLETGDKVGYIIPYDAQIELTEMDVFAYDEEAIDLRLLRRYSKSMRAKHVALMLDSCFSGLAMKRTLPIVKNLDIDYYNDLLSRKAINILTAGDDQPVSDGSGHSPFTRAILNGIGKRGLDIHDRDGYATFNQLSAYVKEKVEKSTSRRQRPQFDNLSEDDGDMVFRLH